MTPYMPHPQVRKILKEASAELRKKSACYSTWYYEEKDKKIVICTTRPGLWIGLYGANNQLLMDKINEELNKHNIEPISIAYIECDS